MIEPWFYFRAVKVMLEPWFYFRDADVDARTMVLFQGC